MSHHSVLRTFFLSALHSALNSYRIDFQDFFLKSLISKKVLQEITMKKISNLKYGLVLLLIAFTVASIITLVSCTSGVDGGENKWVLISFKIEWPQGFDFNCGSGEQVSVRIIALDQDGTEFNWSGSISINSTNANIAVLPSIADIENGSANVTLMFENLSSENQETHLGGGDGPDVAGWDNGNGGVGW
jgi:hypothetical protein